MSTPKVSLTASEVTQALQIVRKSRERIARREVSYICYTLPYTRLGSKLRRGVMACLSLPGLSKDKDVKYQTFEMYYQEGLKRLMTQPEMRAMRLKFLDAWIKILQKAART